MVHRKHLATSVVAAVSVYEWVGGGLYLFDGMTMICRRRCLPFTTTSIVYSSSIDFFLIEIAIVQCVYVLCRDRHVSGKQRCHTRRTSGYCWHGYVVVLVLKRAVIVGGITVSTGARGRRAATIDSFDTLATFALW